MKPRDPSSIARSQGRLRQRVIRDKKKLSKSDRAKLKALVRRGKYDDKTCR